MALCLDAGVHQLLEARASVRQLKDFPLESRPKTLEEAYRLQGMLIERYEDEVVGWKVGATSHEIQELFGIEEPIYGPVFKRTVFASPARLPGRAFQHLMLETEFTFRFREDLPLSTKPLTRRAIKEAVELIPSFEIVSPRFDRLRTDDIPQLTADFCANGGAVFGHPCEQWQDRDLTSHTVMLSIGGSPRREGTGALVLGDPINVLEWFVKTWSAHGRSIRKGQFVMTGTMTGIHTPALCEVALADFGNLGCVEVCFD